MTRYQKIIMGACLLMALGIRIYAALQDNTTVLKGDAAGYDGMAMSLALGKGYRYSPETVEPTASRLPFYPLFLAGIYRTVGHSYPAARMVQAIVSTVTVLVIALWAHRLFGGLSACFAAFIAALYPAFYAYYFSCSALVTETLYVFLFTIALYAFYVYWTRPSWFVAVISGLFWGLSILTRPISLPLLFLLPLILIFLHYPLRALLRYCVIAWFMVGLAMAPWLIRNYLVFGHLVPFSTNASVNLYGNFHPENQDGIGQEAFIKYYISEENRLEALGVSEAERGNYFLKKGLEFIRDYPGHSLKLILRRIFLYMDPRTTLYREERKQIITWGYLFVLAFTVIGFFLSLKYKIYRREILSMISIFGYFVLFHGFMNAAERYRFPNEPILIVVASFALSFSLALLKENWKARVENNA